MDDADDECQDVFEREFYPCMATHVFSNPYYLIRGELIMNTSQKDALKYWMEMQRVKAVHSYEAKRQQRPQQQQATDKAL